MTILLPITKGIYSLENAKGASPSDLSSTIENSTILLVDDDEMVRSSSKRLLERIGFNVLLAPNGEQALEVYGEKKDEIWLVVLDLVMPLMDGEVVFEKLHEIDRNVRVLLSSGYSREGKVDVLLDRGAVGFLQKPFDLKVLVFELAKIRGI